LKVKVRIKDVFMAKLFSHHTFPQRPNLSCRLRVIGDEDDGDLRLILL